MSCVLRVHGRQFEVDKYLKKSFFEPEAIYRKGTPVLTRPGRKHRLSGINILVSARDFSDFDGQKRDAVGFLQKFARQIRMLRRYPGVDEAGLDFGVDWRDGIVREDFFPERLVSLAGALGLALVISHYPAGKSRRRQTGKGLVGRKIAISRSSARRK